MDRRCEAGKEGPHPQRRRIAAHIEEQRGKHDPMARQRHMGRNAEQEGGRDEREARSDQRDGAPCPEFARDAKGECRLQHEAEQQPVAPILEGLRKPWGQQLERNGEQRQAIDQSDGVRQFDPEQRARAGRHAPGGGAIEHPAELVHRAIVEREPGDIVGDENGPTAMGEEDGCAQKHGRRQGQKIAQSFGQEESR